MPNPASYDNQKDWMAACVPTRKEEGEALDQARAVCLSMWRKHTGQPEPEGKATASLEQQQRRIWEAWSATHRGSDAPVATEDGYVVETFDAYVVVHSAGTYWKVPYKDDGESVAFAPQDKWRKVEQQTRWTPAKNALKAISRTDDELRVANYIVLFGGRDLEGLGSENVNEDGSKGEYFTADTDLSSAYTKAGALYEDWEHGQGELGDELLGIVDWKTARVDDKGVFVERVLNRRNRYVQWLEELGWFDDGTLGTSSHADPGGVEKAADGQILRWPLFRDTITVQPMEPRNLTENHIQAFKALGIPLPAQDDTANDSEPPEAEPEADQSAASAAGQGRMRMQLLKNRLTMEV